MEQLVNFIVWTFTLLGLTGNMFFDGVLGSGLVWYITYESPQQNPMMTHGPH